MNPWTTVRVVRSLPSPLRVLFAATLLFRSGTMAFPFLSVYLLVQDGLSPAAVGAIVGAYGVGALVADVVAGSVHRILGGNATMTLGLVSNAVLVAILPFLSGIAALLVVTAVWGFCYEMFTPASYTEIVIRSPREMRKVAFSCHRLAINLGMAVGPAVGGVLFAVAPVLLFYVNAMTVLLAAILIRARLPRTIVSVPAEPPDGPVGATWGEETRFWTIFLLAIPVHFAFALPPVFLSTYVISGRDLPSGWVGSIFAVNALLIVLLEVPLNTAMRTWGHLASLTTGYLLTALGFGLMGLLSTGPGLLGATLVWTTAEMVVSPALMHYVSDISGPEKVSRNMGLYSGGINFGLIIAPVTSLVLAQRYGPGAPWASAAAAVAVAVGLLAVVHRIDACAGHPGERRPDRGLAGPGGGASDGREPPN